MKNYFRFFALFFFLVSADQFFKFVFSDKSTCNKNIAWSISIAPGFFYFFWIAIFFILIYFFLKSQSRLEKTAFVLIFSGGIANMLDRIARGCVVDYIDLKFWPVFNLADIYITIGVILFFLNIIKSKCRKACPKRNIVSGGRHISF